MNVVEIKEKQEISNISKDQVHVQFLQSWTWMLFQRSMGRQSFVLGFKDDGILVGYAIFFIHKLPMWNYLYCPRGPLFLHNVSDEQIKQVYISLLEYLKYRRTKKNSLFLKIEPPETIIKKIHLENVFDESNFVFRKVGFVQPNDTIMLNLNQHEDILLKEMHQKTRYNIRLAKRKGVMVREGGGDFFEVFCDLLCQTAKRQKIRIHPKSYYKNLLKSKDDDFFCKIFVADYESKPIAAYFILYYKNIAVYLHGGTSADSRNVMAPHLLMWKAILSAKKDNCKYFDFYGIAPHYATSSHPLYNIARFKRGFGGFEVNYVGTYDFVFKPFLYKLYFFVRGLRRRIKS